MKNTKVVSNIASNKPDGLSIALIIILVLIIVACILWYMFYKPRPIVRQSVEGFSDEINNLKFLHALRSDQYILQQEKCLVTAKSECRLLKYSEIVPSIIYD